MKVYWDLSETERGTLTESEVERFVDAELMLKGVLKCKPLEFVTVDPLPTPSTHVYVVKCGTDRYNEVEIAFSTAGAAEEFASLAPMILTSEYVHGENIKHTKVISSPELYSQSHFTAEEIAVLRGQIEKSTAAASENKKRQEEWSRARQAERDALKGLWEDWHACRALVARHAQVRATFEEYKQIAGSDSVAAEFLAKVYSAEEIQAALPWIAPIDPQATVGIRRNGIPIAEEDVPF